MEVREQIVAMLREVEAEHSIEAMEPCLDRMLGDRTPASVIETDPEAVLAAARCFRAYG